MNAHPSHLIPISMQQLSLMGGTPLGQLPLLVLVGVTGVGKSTALEALGRSGGHFALLPDRRKVTDVVMILPIAGQAVTDRQERFELTARYRQAHPGGMAQALGELCVDALPTNTTLIFDGLRGLDEVRYAAQHFHAWRFVNLHASDLVRVTRLLGRGDQFDQIAGGPPTTGQALLKQLRAVQGIEGVFSAQELEQLAALEGAGHIADDILAKTKIVVSERRNYDPIAAREYLLTLPPERVLDIDSEALNPAQVASRLEGWL